jgi:hypothetical protein
MAIKMRALRKKLSRTNIDDAVLGNNHCSEIGIKEEE